MTKLSPKSLSILQVARGEFAPTSDERRRLRERILERAASPAYPDPSADAFPAEPPGLGAETKSSRSPVSLVRTHGLKLVGACAFALVGFVAVRQASVATPVNMTANAPLNATANAPVNATATAGDDATRPSVRALPGAPAAEAAPEAATAANDVPGSEPTFSAHLLPDAPPAIASNPSKPSSTNKATAAATGSARTGGTAPATVLEAQAPGISERIGAESPSDSLGAEMRILRDAHGALKNGNTSHARALLDEHARTYPRGVLREERLALSALVLCAEGRTGEARRAAEELAHANPRSSHLERLRGSCVADASPSAGPPSRTPN